jgi:hypothetical protein
MERFIAREDGLEGACEWTHWTTRPEPQHLRGADWFVFDDDIARIREIRAWFACAVTRGVSASALKGFDYAGRGYAMQPPSPAPGGV